MTDLTAIQKQIDAIAYAGIVDIPQGGVVSEPLRIVGKNVTLRGPGPAPITQPAGWLMPSPSFPAGQPLVLFQDCFGGGIEGLHLPGNPSAMPSALVQFDQTATGLTQKGSLLRNVWIGDEYALDGKALDAVQQSQAGLLFTGTHDGDSNSFEHVFIRSCAVGVDIQNVNALGCRFDTLDVSNCGIGMRYAGGACGSNWTFSRNAWDFVPLRAGRILDVSNFNSESSAGFVQFQGESSSLIIRGGWWEMMPGQVPQPGLIIDGGNFPNIKLKLEDFTLYQGQGYSGPLPVIKWPNGQSIKLIDCTGFPATAAKSREQLKRRANV